MGVLQKGVLDFTGQKDDGKSKKKGLLEVGLHAAHVPGFKKGGKVHKTGIYKLHKGETVIPTGKNGCKCSKGSSASMTE